MENNSYNNCHCLNKNTNNEVACLTFLELVKSSSMVTLTTLVTQNVKTYFPALSPPHQTVRPETHDPLCPVHQIDKRGSPSFLLSPLHSTISPLLFNSHLIKLYSSFFVHHTLDKQTNRAVQNQQQPVALSSPLFLLLLCSVLLSNYRRRQQNKSSTEKG